jgi:hypothetical protein
MKYIPCRLAILLKLEAILEMLEIHWNIIMVKSFPLVIETMILTPQKTALSITAELGGNKITNAQKCLQKWQSTFFLYLTYKTRNLRKKIFNFFCKNLKIQSNLCTTTDHPWDPKLTGGRCSEVDLYYKSRKRISL